MNVFHGIHSLRALLATAVACIAMGTAACDRHRGHEGHDHEKDHKHGSGEKSGEQKRGGDHEGEDSEVVKLTAKELAEFGVEVAEAGAGRIDRHINLPGEVVLNPDRTVHVMPRVSGIVREVYRRIGDQTSVNDPLLVVDSAELAEAKADYLAKLQALELERIDLDRTQTIHRNTLEMLKLMKEQPKLEELQKLEGLDVGTNRKELLAAYAAYIAAQAEYGRQKQLFEDNVTAEADLQAVQSKHQAALAGYLATRDDMVFQNKRALDVRQRAFRTSQSQLDTARRKLFTLGLSEQQIHDVPDQPQDQLSLLEVRAPIAGTVIDRHATRGELLKGDTEAFVITDLSSVWVQLTVYQKDLANLRRGQSVVMDFGQDIPSATGAVEYISPVVDEATRTATARVTLANPEGHWRPGLFLDARVDLADAHAAVVVPRSALLKVDGRWSVFAWSEEGFGLSAIEVGRMSRTHAEVLGGLTAGRRYVASGALTLKSEMNKASLAHAGHAH